MKAPELIRHLPKIRESPILPAIEKLKQTPSVRPRRDAQAVARQFSDHDMTVQYARLATMRELVARLQPQGTQLPISFNSLGAMELALLETLVDHASTRADVYILYSLHERDWAKMKNGDMECPDWWLDRRALNNAKAGVRRARRVPGAEPEDPDDDGEFPESAFDV